MTVKQMVLDFLRADAGTDYTNNEIAFQLVLPEPSVRRATGQLELANAIHYVGKADFGRNRWVVYA